MGVSAQSIQTCVRSSFRVRRAWNQGDDSKGSTGMSWTKTLAQVLRGSADANLRFEEVRQLLKRLGFAERVRGDHSCLHTRRRRGDFESPAARIPGQSLSGQAGPRSDCSIPIGGGLRCRISHSMKSSSIGATRIRRSSRRSLNWRGGAADGPTYREALAEVEVVIDEWIETAKELGRPIPEPRGRLRDA